MRRPFLIVLLTLTTALSAQSGRTFRRESRLPVTPAASAVKDAAATRTARLEPQLRLRSGRAWSAFHFSRRPKSTAAEPTRAVDATSRPAVRSTVMWGRPVRPAVTGR